MRSEQADKNSAHPRKALTVLPQNRDILVILEGTQQYARSYLLIEIWEFPYPMKSFYLVNLLGLKKNKNTRTISTTN